MTIDFGALSANPSTPDTNRVKLFARNDVMFFMDETGAVFSMAGGISRVSVVDINDPSPELNSREGAAAADSLIAYEANVGADDVYTIYVWDPDPPGAENVPFTVDGLSGGRWVSIAGRFQNQSIESVKDENFIRFFFQELAGLPSPATFHGMPAHLHAVGDPVNHGTWNFAHAVSWRMTKDHNDDDEVTLTPAATVNIDFGKASATSFTYQNLTLDQDTTLTESNPIGGVIRLLRINSGTPGQKLTLPGNWELFGSYDTSGSANLIEVTCVSPSVEELRAGGSPPAGAYVANITNLTESRGNSQTGLGDSAAGLLTVNVGDPAHLDIADRVGQIENRTDLTNIFPDPVAWTGLTNITLPNIATAPFTNIYIVETAPGSGIGVELLDNLPLTSSSGRTRIYLGTAIHQGGTVIEQLLIIPILSYDTASSVVDLFTQFGDQSTGNVYSASGSNKLLNKASGNVFGRQIGIIATPLQPHSVITPPQVAITPYTYSRRDGVGGFTFSSEADIDPDFFDDGSGTLAAVPVGRFTHQPIHFDPRSGVTILEYGQTTYATQDEAVDGINQNGFIFNGLLDSIEITTWIIAPEGTGDLGSDAEFSLPLVHAVPPSGALVAHAVTHENGGSDEISVLDLSGLLADAQTPLAHAASHENGGSDEINVAGLSGLLADGQTPTAHAASHSNGGSDEITVENLGTASSDVSTALRPDGAGGLAFVDVAHADLTGVTANQHHTEDHAARHSDGGADEIITENLATASTDTTLVLSPDGAGGTQFASVPSGGGSVFFSWKFSTTISEADPGVGNFRFNNATPASVTRIYIDSITDGGINLDNFFSEIKVGEEIAIQQADDPSKLVLAEVTAIIDNTGWWRIDVTVDTSGTLFTNNRLCVFVFHTGNAPISHDDLTNVTSDQHHPQLHAAAHADGGGDELQAEALATASADVSTALRPDGVGGLAFSDVAHADLTGVTVNQHHPQLHASAHSENAPDEIFVENLGATSADTSTALRPDGTGGLTFTDVAHADLTGVTVNQHHTEDHAARHAENAADELLVENLGATSTDTSTALRPDGTGGLAFSDVAHTDLSGVTIDQHHARDHAAAHSENGADEVFVENLGAISTNVAQALRPDGTGGVEWVSEVKEWYQNLGYSSVDDAYRIRGVASNGSANITFVVPGDFVSLVSLEIIGKADGSVSGVSIDLSSDYGAVGQSTTTHSETDTTTTYSFTSGIQTATDISTVFSSLDAGDSCGLFWDNKSIGAALALLHMKLVYNT